MREGAGLRGSPHPITKLGAARKHKLFGPRSRSPLLSLALSLAIFPLCYCLAFRAKALNSTQQTAIAKSRDGRRERGGAISHIALRGKSKAARLGGKFASFSLFLFAREGGKGGFMGALCGAGDQQKHGEAKVLPRRTRPGHRGKERKGAFWEIRCGKMLARVPLPCIRLSERGERGREETRPGSLRSNVRGSKPPIFHLCQSQNMSRRKIPIRKSRLITSKVKTTQS